MKAVKQLGKMMGAAIVAVIILSLIVSVYSLSPLRVKNPQGNTDYVWKPDSIWANMSEGVSLGRMDANGFNNPEVIETPDIILLGSSHIESKNVNQNENTAFYLTEDFDDRYSVYNMGISGHTFYKVCQYLPDTLSVYQDNEPKYIVIETDDIDLTKAGVNAILNHTVETTPVYDSGLVATLQKNPAFRLFYHQLDSGMMEILFPELTKNKTMQSNSTVEAQNDETTPTETSKPAVDTAPYDQLMSYLGDLEQQYNTDIIIFFHPYEQLNADGSLSFTNNENTVVFAEYAEKYGITYIDMTDSFEQMYDEDHHVPHGFLTGEIASGHLNKYGHKAIADRLYDTISRMEG